MNFVVLGPVRVEGAAAPVSAPLLRTLVAVLVIRANRVVPVDVLVDSLWGERLGGSSGRLQVLVHRLRRAMGEPARLGFVTGGYRLRIEPGELDAERFEARAAEGADAAGRDPHRATAVLREALGLWEGEAFAGAGDVAEIRAEADRLGERRLGAYELLYQAELALGHAASVIPDLAALAARNPFRERLQGLLMRALYSCGRQADALAAYQRARLVLVEQLGIEPGAELRELERGVLAGGDLDIAPAARLEALPRAVPTPRQLPADIADFCGRAGDLARILGPFESQRAAVRSPGRALPISAVSGKAGVGKTTLAVHAAHRLTGRYPDGQLHVDLQGAQAEPLDPGDVLAGFLRALGIEGPAIPEHLDERARLFRSRLADRRVLVVLDNAASVAQVRLLLPGAPGCGVLVTSRARLSGLDGAQLVDVDVLEVDQAVEMLAGVAEDPRIAADRSTAREIVGLCGCLPLAVRVVAARLAARPTWGLDRLRTLLGDEHHRLDQLRVGDLEVRASIALSYRGLGTEAQRAFRLLGLLEAADFASWVTAAVLDELVADAELVVEELVDAQLLELGNRDATGEQRYRFHDLIRLYARERARADDDAGQQRAALERAFGAWLGLAEEANRRQGEIYQFAGGAAAPGRVAPATAARVLADPLSWLEAELAAMMAAVEQAAGNGMSRPAWAMSDALRMFPDRGYAGRWYRLYEVSLACCREAGDQVGEAVMLLNLGYLHRIDDRFEAAADLLDRAARDLTKVGERNAAALARCYLSDAYRWMGRFVEARRSAEDGLGVARAVGDERIGAKAWHSLGELAYAQGSFAEAASCFETAAATFARTGFRGGEAGLLFRLGAVQQVLGRPVEAGRNLRRSLEICTAMRQRHHRALARLERAAVEATGGHLDSATGLLAQALATFREIGDRSGEAMALNRLGDVRRQRGQLAGAQRCLHQALAVWAELKAPVGRARTLQSLGDVHLAAGVFEAAAHAWSQALETFREVGSTEGEELAERIREVTELAAVPS